MEKKLENDMETGVIWGLKELNVRYYIGAPICFTLYTQYGTLIQVPDQQPSNH